METEPRIEVIIPLSVGAGFVIPDIIWRITQAGRRPLVVAVAGQVWILNLGPLRYGSI